MHGTSDCATIRMDAKAFRLERLALGEVRVDPAPGDLYEHDGRSLGHLYVATMDLEMTLDDRGDMAGQLADELRHMALRLQTLAEHIEESTALRCA